MHPFEIFKPGRHTATNGETLDFSAADVVAIAASYYPALGAAPIAAAHRPASLTTAIKIT